MEYDRLQTEVEDGEKEIEDCQDKIPQLEKQYKFYQEIRGYVRDLVECLNEKVPVINDFENRMKTMLRQQADLLIQRRQQDVRDQCQDYMTNKKHQVVMETQEEYSRQRRVAEREARRSRRRRKRENKNLSGHHDGLSSDDEENQFDISRFNLERDDVLAGSKRLFEDVVEEFSELDYAKKQFERWKKLYGDTYQEAYIGLCLPKLLNPFIRLSLLDWNPLKEVCNDIEEFSWYNSLVLYSCHSNNDIVPDPDDDDIRLLPAIVDKIVLPKLSYICEYIWDPLSTSQTSRLVNLIQKLIKDYPTVSANNKNTQNLLKCIADRMKKCLDDDVFMPLYPKSVLENRSSGPAVFFHRQLWTCIKLLGNILSWQGILSSHVLQQLSLDGLLNRYIVLGLNTSCLTKEALEKCQAIISTFPKEWFNELNGECTLPKLENLCRYLLQTAEHLHKGSIMVRDSERLEIRNHIKQISKMLIMIQATNHAISLSNTYSFKITQV
ncbi:hypothetical protein LOTGIDRAFT_190915 [Lottia gigantea]|uniref:GCF C-terminal domain-containing protein n=1 Tax=Lottia gigantea TaxID=225164 RepID=V4AFI7_LOTGI|nr:hypothetical protein LOTGIDRAFT_190915 [Lottia gigantea]ESO92141.1 hypothetical protein LOTGIDRAFT_190915 [Lottia gigantea]